MAAFKVKPIAQMGWHILYCHFMENSGDDFNVTETGIVILWFCESDLVILIWWWWGRNWTIHLWSKDTNKWRTLAAGSHDGQIILLGDNFDTGKHDLEQDHDDGGLSCANVQECKVAAAAGVIGSEIAAEKKNPCFKKMTSLACTLQSTAS